MSLELSRTFSGPNDTRLLAASLLEGGMVVPSQSPISRASPSWISRLNSALLLGRSGAERNLETNPFLFFTWNREFILIITIACVATYAKREERRRRIDGCFFGVGDIADTWPHR